MKRIKDQTDNELVESILAIDLRRFRIRKAITRLTNQLGDLQEDRREISHEVRLRQE